MPTMSFPLCTDGRMLGLEGSGVATYAAALRRAQLDLDGRSRLLIDRSGAMRSDPAQCRAARWIAALWPATRWALAGRAADGSLAFLGRDLFRLAQVWFDVHGRLLPVRVPGPPGIMHWSYPVPLRLVGWHNLYTIHDAIPLTTPDLSSIDGHRLRRLLRRIATAATRLVTVSEAAREEIARALRLDATRIVDCGQAVEAPQSTDLLPAGLRPRGYLLAVGTIEPRKNVARLVEAWRASRVALPLVLVGRDGWRAGECVPGDDPRLLRLGSVAQPMLAALLANARALLMPSLAEGFGLPVMEAMAMGTPVLTSRGGALEEVSGGAALLVDPLRTDAIAEGIRRLATDDVMAAKLAAAGPRNAARFSPACFAARLGALYATVRAEPAA